MPWRGPEYPGEFPTLGYEVAQWIQSYCVVPDRDARGLPFLLTEEQLRFFCHYYRLDETGNWYYRRGAQLLRPQKWGKGPLAAAWVCGEAAGPVTFAGWSAAGEPVGAPWPTPHIQITACSEEQTANTWRALQPMIELGSLGVDYIPDTGLTRINLPGGGLIEPVTASARSRLGQRITGAVQDQTESWVAANNGHWLADNQRRNLAGMGGRFLETGNAYAPEDDSVAQRTQREPGVYIDDVDGGFGSVRNKAERRRVMTKVYGDSLKSRGGWVDLDRIEVEIDALLEHDPAQAERFFLHRKLAAEGAAFNLERYDQLKAPRTIPRGKFEPIAIGVDGARYDDALAVVATHIQTGYQWPLAIIERPPNAPDNYEHDFSIADGAVTEATEDYLVWRIYIDDQWIGPLVDDWQNRFGKKRVIAWLTNRPRQIAWAVRGYEDAIASGDLSHDGDETMRNHIRNARRRRLSILDDKERQMHTITKAAIGSPDKIDAAMAAILSWEARQDCIAMGAVDMAPATPEPAPTEPADHYRPGHAPALVGLGASYDSNPTP